MSTDGTVDGVVGIFRRVLESDRVQPDSDFFELGGDSLLATRVLSAIAREFGPELTLADIIDAPSPLALAKLIEGVAA
ncbi:phosphopantetheine-binding protein [Streptacidiphilus griseoplanus]|uniref:phosphopantetheine-binding protein n=1 Tax=Peterkaempfera griseoplana TaxID=66896 RepID=UPI0006E38080|nr:phosphopantetheine-binding protein [Peterkaempfera griseoplana]